MNIPANVRLTSALLTHDQELQHMLSECELSGNTRSNANQQLCIDWFEACKNSHKTCNHPKTRSSWLPTRLLTIDPTSRREKVRIIETSQDSQQLEYMALSYCWGSKPILSLTAQSAGYLKQGIPSASLPQTFRDAV